MPVCAVRRAVISTPPSSSSDVCIFNMLCPNLSSRQFGRNPLQSQSPHLAFFSVRGAFSHLAFFCALFYHLVKQISLSEPHCLKVTTYGDWPIGYDGKRSYLPLWKGEGRILKNLPPSEVGAVFVLGLAARPPVYVLPSLYWERRERFTPPFSPHQRGGDKPPHPFWALRAARSPCGVTI